MSKGLYGKFEDCKKEEEWLPVSFDLETCSWQKQELYKGRKSLLGILGTTDWSGWGFNESLPNVKVWDEADANAVTDMNIFKTNTVFKLNPVSITNSVATRIETDRHLAMGIPALSPATGRTPVADVESVNMQEERLRPNGWARPGNGARDECILHSDIKNASYFFIYRVFDEIIQIGELQ